MSTILKYSKIDSTNIGVSDLVEAKYTNNFYLDFNGEKFTVQSNSILNDFWGIPRADDYHTDEETIFQENALYKVKSSFLFEERQIQNIIKASHATIVTVSPEFFVIEKTGFREETEQLRKDLSPFGLLQFVRSGRISVTKAKMGISEILNTFKNNN